MVELSQREQQIMDLWALGHTCPAIARELRITTRRVRDDLKEARKKFGSVGAGLLLKYLESDEHTELRQAMQEKWRQVPAEVRERATRILLFYVQYEHGVVTNDEIARRLGIGRTTIYTSLQELADAAGVPSTRNGLTTLYYFARST